MVRLMREFFMAGGLKLSYLDFGGGGGPLLALHGHYNEASAFAPLAAAPYLECSFRQRPGGWGFSFDPDDTVASQKALNGDHWDDWMGVSCSTLLVRGTRSDELAADHARDMVARTGPRARLVEVEAGHVVHHDAPEQFAAEVAAFLSEPC